MENNTQADISIEQQLKDLGFPSGKVRYNSEWCQKIGGIDYAEKAEVTILCITPSPFGEIFKTDRGETNIEWFEDAVTGKKADF